MSYELLSVIAPTAVTYVSWAIASNGALALYDGVEDPRLKLPVVLALYLAAALLATRAVLNLGQV